MSNNENPNEMTGKITVAEAATLTANWRSYLAASGQGFQTKAFLIPINSIKNLLDTNPDAEAVRIYLGLEDATNPNTGKVVMVPVVDGNDVMYISGSMNRGSEEDDSNIYDRSKACPPVCGDDNDLNGDGDGQIL